MRNESLATVSIITHIFGNGRMINFAKQPWTLAAWLTAATYATILLLMRWRFMQRGWLWRRFARELDSAAVSPAEDRFRIMGHANDTVVLPLLISPIVWNHHYLVLLPALVWSSGLFQRLLR